ncbi:hypothetical protein [uncultured Roseobacter sp.]|uniref:hypothetical protein n=1 Tax=uncultured Roseobacter sp. TaxID=114847 RepID=UPI00261D2C60|nr:hypothetical protein [uncultured Roseobacter sp.]
MKHIIYSLWVLPIAGLWLAVTLWGTPHVIGTYTYTGSRYLPPAERHYTTCTYYGWAGVITVDAIDAACPWVRFLKAGPQ